MSNKLIEIQIPYSTIVININKIDFVMKTGLQYQVYIGNKVYQISEASYNEIVNRLSLQD